MTWYKLPSHTNGTGNTCKLFFASSGWVFDLEKEKRAIASRKNVITTLFDVIGPPKKNLSLDELGTDIRHLYSAKHWAIKNQVIL